MQKEIEDIIAEARKKIFELTGKDVILTGYMINNDDNDMVGNFMNFVSSSTGISTEDLKSGKREKEITATRQSLLKIFRENFLMSTVAAGEILNRDHSTVIHACRKKDLIFMAVYTKILNLYDVFIKAYNNGEENKKADVIFPENDFMNFVEIKTGRSLAEIREWKNTYLKKGLAVILREKFHIAPLTITRMLNSNLSVLYKPRTKIEYLLKSYYEAFHWYNEYISRKQNGTPLADKKIV